MDLSPSSSGFRLLCGAAIAYGLTDGGYNSEMISLTPLGRRIVAPTREGDDSAARREATLRPRVIRDFLTRYNSSKLPPEAIGRNVLEEIGVPSDRTQTVYTLIVESARSIGLLQEVKGQIYVDLESATGSSPAPVQPDTETTPPDAPPATDVKPARSNTPVTPAIPAATPGTRRTNRVFITHGKNHEIVNQLKEMLTFETREHEYRSAPRR
jgi:hypothetical protein